LLPIELLSQIKIKLEPLDHCQAVSFATLASLGLARLQRGFQTAHFIAVDSHQLLRGCCCGVGAGAVAFNGAF
jgi:hypothetical protein